MNWKNFLNKTEYTETELQEARNKAYQSMPYPFYRMINKMALPTIPKADFDNVKQVAKEWLEQIEIWEERE